MSRNLTMTYGDVPGATFISAAGLAREAHQRLSRGEESWAKGGFFIGGGECALGAIANAAQGRYVTAASLDKVQELLLENLKAVHPAVTATTIADLNDDPAVTYEGVLVAFEKTVLQLEEAV